ncbi:protein of unknown function [Nitrospira defluvii]|uniref:Uncharacterized protein n=1 Tax=Nitrospira defluvii TaxID=330214 RepID=D8P9P9_9BACT|nr:protein of unknown function [Nitrospira defluvii]
MVAPAGRARPSELGGYTYTYTYTYKVWLRL